MNRIPLLALALAVCPLSSPASLPGFDAAPSAAGLTGGIELPGTGTPKVGEAAFGVHASQPKANFGLPLPGLEAGVATQLRSTGEFRDLLTDARASIKYRFPLPAGKRSGTAFPLALAAGLEESGARPHAFGVASFSLSRVFWKGLAVEASCGAGTGRFSPLFGGLTVRVHKQVALIAEAEGPLSHGGMRMLLSPSLRLDLFMLNLASPLGESAVREFFRERIRIGVTTTVALWRRGTR